MTNAERNEGTVFQLKQITETALTHLLAAHPNAKVEQRGHKRVVMVPFYDIDTDEAGFLEKEIVPDPDETRMGILPVMNVRKGAAFNPKGEVREGPFGQLYRILGWSPPEKDSKD